MRKGKREKVKSAKDEKWMDEGGKKAGKGVPQPHAGLLYFSTGLETAYHC